MPILNHTLSSLRTVALLAIVLAALIGCGPLGVYKMDINQGNYLTRDVVARLKQGQTRQQVRVLLGTPLITDPFHADRWDYVYSFSHNGSERENRKFSVFFEGDKLVRWQGDEMPISDFELNRMTRVNADSGKNNPEQ